MFIFFLFFFKAKIFSDIEPVENLLVGDDLVANRMRQQQQQPMNPNDDDDNIGGIDDDFEIPCTAATNEPFFTQHGGEFVMQTQNDQMLMMNMSANGNPDDTLHAQNHFGDGLAPMPFDGDNLIEAPIQVNALNIEYAKTSKNIDVRRLKQVMWNLISSNNDKVVFSFCNLANMKKSRFFHYFLDFFNGSKWIQKKNQSLAPRF